MRPSTLAGRLWSPAGFGLVFIFFLLPFLTVSCGDGNRRIDSTFNGVDVVVGGAPAGRGGGGTDVVSAGFGGGGAAATSGLAWPKSADEMLTLGSSAGALAQPKTVQPPFSA